MASITHISLIRASLEHKFYCTHLIGQYYTYIYILCTHLIGQYYTYISCVHTLLASITHISMTASVSQEAFSIARLYVMKMWLLLLLTLADLPYGVSFPSYNTLIMEQKQIYIYNFMLHLQYNNGHPKIYSKRNVLELKP